MELKSTPKVKDDNYYLKKIIDEIDLIVQYSKGVSLYDLYLDSKTVDAVILRFIQISEHADKISDTFKLIHNDIEWRQIKGFRNRLVHDYGDVDLHYVYSAITIDIIKLRDKISSLL